MLVARLLTILAFLFCALPVLCAELKKVVFMPQWVPQTQFAGYYVAKDKGFFEDEGLNVIIRHIGVNSKESLLDNLIRGKADVIGAQLPQSIAARSKGAKIVNVCQVTQMSGLWVVAHKPLRELKDLNHMRIAKWQSGFTELCDVLCHEFNLDVEWVSFHRDVNLFIYRAVDATLCFSYSEYLRLLLAMGRIPEENVLRFSDHGLKSPEDALYVTDEYYRNNKDTVDAFVRAVKRGWKYTAEHQEEACAISRMYIEDGHVGSNKVMERMMLQEYLRLQVNPATGKRDFAPVGKQMFEDLVDAMYRAAIIDKKVTYDEMIRP